MSKAKGNSKNTSARSSPGNPLPLAQPNPGDSLIGWLLPCYLLLIGLGFLIYRLPFTMVGGNQMSIDRALFASVNAGTLTGFQQVISVNTYLLPGQIMAFLLTFGGAFFTLSIGGMAAVRILRLPYSQSYVILASILTPLLATILGGLPLISQGRPLPIAFTQALAAFSNSGTTLGKPFAILDWQVHLILLPLALLGGLGLPVLLELPGAILRRQSLSIHSRTVIVMTAALYLIPLILFTLIQWPDDFDSLRNTLASSSAASLNARTPGLPVDHLYQFPRITQWILVLLMIIGASPAGTGGGLKTTTLAEIFRSIPKILRGQTIPKSFAIALTWVGAYLTISITCLLLLIWSESQLPADRILFIAFSAASNVGLSHDPISITGPGLYILSATMLLARIFPMIILWWLVESAPDSDLLVG